MKVLVISAFLCLFVCRAYAVIHCYQCVSTDLHNPFQCNEYMEDSDLRPAPCDSVYNAAYCIKQTGRFEGGLGTKRYCSSLDLGNYCNYIKQPGDDLEYRSCVYTCDTDGCNSSNPLSVSSSCIILTFLYYIFRNVNCLNTSAISL